MALTETEALHIKTSVYTRIPVPKDRYAQQLPKYNQGSGVRTNSCHHIAIMIQLRSLSVTTLLSKVGLKRFNILWINCSKAISSGLLNSK